METSMNRQSLEWLIWRLKNQVDDRHFEMSYWLTTADTHQGLVAYRDEESIPHCKTAGCIAGHVFLGLTPEQRTAALLKYGRDEYGAVVRYTAQDVLDMSESTEWLFAPADAEVHKRIKRKHVIKLLEGILKTGYADWRKALPPSLFSKFDDWQNPIKVELTVRDESN